MEAKMNKTLALASVLFTVGALSGAAQAAPVMCSGGTATYTGTDPDATVDVSDVTLGGSAADDCFYDVTAGASDDTAEQGIINATDWATVPEFSDKAPGTSDPFSFAAKDDIGGSDVSNTVLGITWSLTFTASTNSSGSTTPESGTWKLAWTDPSPPETFPLYFDVVVLFKAANSLRMGYLFDNIEVASAPGNSSGTYEVNIINNGGKFAGLSHGSFAVRAGTGPDDPVDPDPMPVPGTLLLLGLGLFGLRFARKSAV
jgi:hypothetical protein